jgi:glycosyltransferase involved in cell wall biosynthesis
LKLTIAIPNYNNEENIRRCLESCKFINLNQEDFEILIVDNASTDNSILIIHEFQSIFKNIRLIQNKKNLGRIENWNKCLDYCKGEYLIFLFTNDEIHQENNVDKLLRIMDKNKNISISVSSFYVNNNKEILRMRLFNDNLICSSKELVKKCIDRSIFPFGLLSLIFRKEEIINSNIKFPESLPGNTDQVFSILHAYRRKFILFNPKPQIKWNVTKKRHHFQSNPNETLDGHTKAHSLISRETNYLSSGKYLFSYYLIKSVYYLNNNKSKLFPFIKYGFSHIRKNLSSFGIDPLFVKSIFKKIRNNSENIHELYLKEIVNSCSPKKISD